MLQPHRCSGSYAATSKAPQWLWRGYGVAAAAAGQTNEAGSSLTVDFSCKRGLRRCKRPLRGRQRTFATLRTAFATLQEPFATLQTAFATLQTAVCRVSYGRLRHGKWSFAEYVANGHLRGRKSKAFRLLSLLIGLCAAMILIPCIHAAGDGINFASKINGHELVFQHVVLLCWLSVYCVGSWRVFLWTLPPPP